MRFYFTFGIKTHVNNKGNLSMLTKIFFLILICCVSLGAFSSFVPDYEKLNWDGIDVIFVKDDRVPMYQVDFISPMVP